MSSPDLNAIRALIEDESDRAGRDMPPLDSLIADARTRQRRRRGTAFGAVLGAAVIVGGVGLTLGNDQPVVINDPASSSPFQSAGAEPSADPRPDQVAERLSNALSAQGRDGGATWISEHKTLNVYVAGPTEGKAAAVDKIKTLASELTNDANFTVAVHAGGVRTESQLVAAMDTISHTKNYDPDGKVQIRSQRIDYATGQVEVDVTSQAAADIVEKKFGDAVHVQVKAPYTQEELDEMFGMEDVPAPDVR